MQVVLWFGAGCWMLFGGEDRKQVQLSCLFASERRRGEILQVFREKDTALCAWLPAQKKPKATCVRIISSGDRPALAYESKRPICGRGRRERAAVELQPGTRAADGCRVVMHVGVFWSFPIKRNCVSW